MPQKKKTCSCGKKFIPRKRYRGLQAPEGGWLCGVHGPSGTVARQCGYSCGLPESSGSSTGTDADVSEVAGAVSSGDGATSDVGVTEESSAALTGTGADVCVSPPVSRRWAEAMEKALDVLAAQAARNDDDYLEKRHQYTQQLCTDFERMFGHVEAGLGIDDVNL